jgi:hypothetical protein
MCCFAQRVKNVANTRIFCRLTDRGSQFLVYQMDYESAVPNAMILPIPTQLPATEDQIQFLNLEAYATFFSDLESGYPQLQNKKLIMPSTSSRTSVDSAPLKVHSVGSFVASFVPTIDDFDRLDPQFVIPRSSWEKIPIYHDYGFAVFQLKSLHGRIHPIALEFPTRMPDQVFFPTVHIHDGEVHQQEHFDHTLYLQDDRWDSRVSKYDGPEKRDPSTGFVRSQKVAKHFMKPGLAQNVVSPDLLVHRRKFFGSYANHDRIVPRGVAALPLIQSNWLGYAAGTSVAAGMLAWLYWRRNRVRTETHAPSREPEIFR